MAPDLSYMPHTHTHTHTLSQHACMLFPDIVSKDGMLSHGNACQTAYTNILSRALGIVPNDNAVTEHSPGKVPYHKAQARMHTHTHTHTHTTNSPLAMMG